MARDTARCPFCDRRSAAEDAHTPAAHRASCPKRQAMERKASATKATTARWVDSICRDMTPSSVERLRATLTQRGVL